MEEIWQSILLGALQGIAEFLPISSSGHLEVAKRLFGLSEIPPLFTVFLHLATLCTVILFFRKQIAYLIAVFFRLIFRKAAPRLENESEETALAREKDGRRYIVAVILASIPTAIIGLGTETVLQQLPLKAIFIGFFVTAFLLVCAGILLKKKRAGRRLEEKKAPSWAQALLIGVFQGVGTLPGVSRSGSTISGAVFTGVDRVTAGEFSFIISIPAVLGAFLLELKDLGSLTASMGFFSLALGFISAFLVGYLSLWLLMKIIKRGRLEFFALYLIPIGILGLIFLK